MKVVYHKNVTEYLNELIDILYDKEYFGFKDAALSIFPQGPLTLTSLTSLTFLTLFRKNGMKTSNLFTEE